MSKQPPPAPTASAVGPCPTVIQIVGRPGTGSLPSTIAPPDLPVFKAFKKIIVRYKKIGYNIHVDVLRQTACLVVNAIKVNNFAYLFDCTTVGWASD